MQESPNPPNETNKVILDGLGLIVNEGKIIDASFVVAPRLRNTLEENRKTKNVQ